jgi:hypothetical protein
MQKAAVGGIKTMVGNLAKVAVKAAAAHVAKSAKEKVKSSFTGLLDGVKSVFGGGSDVESKEKKK